MLNQFNFFLDRETQGIHWKNTGNNNNNKDETKTKNNNRKEERKLGWWKVNEKLEKRLSCKSSFAQPSSLLFVLFFLFVILRNIMITMDMQPSSLLFVFLDALASLKTMFKIQLLMFSRLLDFKSITEYYRV